MQSNRHKLQTKNKIKKTPTKPQQQKHKEETPLKHKILKLTPEELIRALQGNTTQHNYPTDTELIDIKYDAFTKQVTTIIRSNTFEEVPEGTPTPEYTHKTTTNPQQPQTPTITDTPTKTPTNNQTTTIQQKSLIQTLTATPTQPTSSTSIGTGVKTLGPKPETKLDTCGFEDEFTKEQRKVLKFTSSDDYVIVKPTQFLKTEWEDINDTVKSIGGKWVKGATIDYWAIPKKQKMEE
jgi:hypothetical protein